MTNNYLNTTISILLVFSTVIFYFPLVLIDPSSLLGVACPKQDPLAFND